MPATTYCHYDRRRCHCTDAADCPYRKAFTIECTNGKRVPVALCEKH